MTHVLIFPWEPSIATPVTVERVDDRVWVRLADPDPDYGMTEAFPVDPEWLREVTPL